MSSSDEERGGPQAYVSIHGNRHERARRYEEVRAQRESKFRWLIKTHSIEMVIGIAIYFISPWLAGDKNNYYTQNHMNYNQLTSLALIEWDIFIILAILLKDNLFRGRKCCHLITYPILIIMRTALLL